MSESGNANAKLCPACERVKILASMDLCSGCGLAADSETRRDMPAIERFAAKRLAFEEWCERHGVPNPYGND